MEMKWYQLKQGNRRGTIFFVSIPKLPNQEATSLARSMTRT